MSEKEEGPPIQYKHEHFHFSAAIDETAKSRRRPLENTLKYDEIL